MQPHMCGVMVGCMGNSEHCSTGEACAGLRAAPPSRPSHNSDTKPQPLPASAMHPLQSSKVQLWVVKMHGGSLKPYSVRATPTGTGELPSENTERAIEM